MTGRAAARIFDNPTPPSLPLERIGPIGSAFLSVPELVVMIESSED